MENKKDNGLSKVFWITLASICVVFVSILTIGIILFENRKEEVIEKNEDGGQITLNYTNNVTGLTLENVAPTTDAIAMKDMTESRYFDFFIDVDLKKANSMEYEISVIKEKSSTISDEDIRIYLEKEESGTYSKVFGPSPFTPISKASELGSEKNSMILVKSKTKKSLKDNYRLRVWLSDKSLLPTGSCTVSVVVNGIAK